ncbi:MAG: hypothetical protein ACPLZH_00870 [Minisyncoccales bacterium]
MEVFTILITFLNNWWWLILSYFLFKGAIGLYFWWLRWEMNLKKTKWILLEIKPPAENIKPLSAMEDLYDMLWSVYDAPNWRERWIEGTLPKAPNWFSWEIVSFGGEIKFYLRIKQDWKESIIAAIRTHYPETEISESPDYVYQIPQNIPNDEYDLFGFDYTILKKDYFPIKTYFDFETEPVKVAAEEVREIRVEPLNSLLEELAQLKPHEKALIQIVCAPLLSSEAVFDVVKEGKKYIAQLRGESVPKKEEFFIFKLFFEFWNDLREVVSHIITGIKGGSQQEKQKEEKLKHFLTPGEQKLAEKIERKMGKKLFKTWIRFLYIYKINEKQTPGAAGIFNRYIHHFVGDNLMVFMGPTRTKIQYWFRKRRLFLRKRRLWRYYIERLPSSFPWNWNGRPVVLPFYPISPGEICRAPIFDSEELTTIFHFPLKIILPQVPRVETKKGTLPPGVPLKE